MPNPAIESSNDIVRTLGLDADKPHRRVLRIVIPTCALLAALCAVVWVQRTRSRAAGMVQYDTRPVTRGDVVKTVSATGTLQPVKQVDVGIEVSGTIKTVDVDYNDSVTNGQVLARIDTSKLDAQVLQSEAALDSAHAKLLQVKATVLETQTQLARLTHVRELSNGKVPSQSEFEAQQASLSRALADEASAKAAITQAVATLCVNRSDRDKAEIHSPIKGIVLSRTAEPGQTVAAAFSTPVLFTLAEDLAQIELRVDVDEADVGQVQDGQEASFTVDAYPDRHFPARVKQVRFGSKTVDGVVTYTTVLNVDNASLSLRPGMTATAAITTRKVTNVLRVPNAALRFEPPQTKVTDTGNGSASIVGSLLPHPPHAESRAQESTAGTNREHRVWMLRDGQLMPFSVVDGVTDGVFTEISGALEPGAAVVVDILAAK
ncbi:MAG: efflux RND transporter periplasmic adaptor subunit [Kiritimatiellia bacterium]